jgi:uncharacterized protein YjbJ (UPF0337 family)
MNSDTIEGSWKEIKGKVRQQWGKLTDDELDVIAGNRERLEGAIQKAYGRSREEVKKEVDTFTKSCGCG